MLWLKMKLLEKLKLTRWVQSSNYTWNIVLLSAMESLSWRSVPICAWFFPFILFLLLNDLLNNFSIYINSEKSSAAATVHTWAYMYSVSTQDTVIIRQTCPSRELLSVAQQAREWYNETELFVKRHLHKMASWYRSAFYLFSVILL